MKTKLPCVKSAAELDLTKEQRKNLAHLCCFVEKSVPPPEFNIKQFNSDKFDRVVYVPSEAKYECGTTACFCGYGPLAGIAPTRKEGWIDYARRVFNAHARGNSIYPLLFDERHVNSKSAAVLRGCYFLMHGLPEGKYYDELCRWEVPADFIPNWHSIRAVASAK